MVYNCPQGNNLHANNSLIYSLKLQNLFLHASNMQRYTEIGVANLQSTLLCFFLTQNIGTTQGYIPNFFEDNPLISSFVLYKHLVVNLLHF